MKALRVTYVPHFDVNKPECWDTIPQNKIACANWTDFPYQPEVSFKIVHDGKTIYIHYAVIEKFPVRMVHTQDQDPVYQDSCVEFFILDDEGLYHNFECNAKGAILSATGKNRTNRKQRSNKELQDIKRQTSGVEKIGDNYHWSLSIGIPFVSVGVVRGNSYRANFYKCGDLTESKHYLSWHPIHTQKPDFHCPEHFGSIEIE